MKKVLVLLASYNGEKYIEEQLESLYAQKNVDVSVLVRDDGSTDGTCEILKKHSEMGKLTWYTGPHMNVDKGFFDLMKKASEYSFDYVAFCDQDDVWDCDKLYVAVSSLEKMDNNIPLLYYCGQRLVDGEMNFLCDHILNDKRSMITRFVLSDFAGCTGVFNKCLLNEVVKYEPDYMLMHDTWVLKVCLCLGGEVFVDVMPHMNYRQHGGNTVGLGRSLSAYLKQVDQYLNIYHVEAQIQELVRGYGDRMVPVYRELSDLICTYKTHKNSMKKLLDKSYVNFYNKGLNLTYWLKVYLRKL